MKRELKAILHDVKIIVAGIAIIAALYFLIQWRSARSSHVQLQELLADTIHHFEMVVTAQGQEINIQTQTVASLENAIAAGLIEKEDLKNKNLKYVNHIIKLENQIVFYEELLANVDTGTVVVIDSSNCPDIDDGTYLKVPAKFVYANEWISFAGTVYGYTVGMQNLIIRQEPTIYLGYQKTGLFKPLRPVVTVEDANPYVHTIAMQNVQIQKKPPFYSRPWFHFLGGAVSMVAIQVAVNQLRLNTQ